MGARLDRVLRYANRMACFVAMLTADGHLAASVSLAPLTAVPPFHQSAPQQWSHHAAAWAVRSWSAAPSTAHASASHADAGLADVVFDGRLDDRAALVARLGLRDSPEPSRSRWWSDPELVRRAYLAWGVDLADRLLGDYAFCVWDRREHRLLGVRDRLGVKPLYYAWDGRTLLLSNVLASLRRSPLVSPRLSDRAVGDFLLFGDPQDPGETMLADVRRVPPGHVLQARPGVAPVVSRYWRFDHPAVARCASAGAYVEQYRELLTRAVGDRVPDGPVSILMSGGLDSGSIAACVADRAAVLPCVRPRAYTVVYRRRFDDPELAASAVSARALGVPLEHMGIDDYGLFDRWDADARPVAPLSEPLTAITADLLARAGRHAGVALSGDGGDPLLLPATVPRHVGKVPLSDLARDVWRSLWTYRQRPLLGLRSTWRGLWARAETPPDWLSDRLLRHYDVRARWRAITEERYDAHDLRHESMADLRSTWWPAAFESGDPGATRQPVEVRYPFFDLRLVSFSLALPSYPWCVDKTILREAMRGRLPDATRLRPKTPLAGDPFGARNEEAGPAAIRALERAPGMDAFVNLPKFRAAADGGRADTLAAVSLAQWLWHEQNAGRLPMGRRA